jgi:hypothetical protein
MSAMYAEDLVKMSSSLYFNIEEIIKKEKVICAPNFFSLTWCSSQFVRISTNPTGSEVNDHISLQ